MASSLRGLLWLLSLPYAAVTAARNGAYDRGWLKVHRCEVPVLSVGNLTVGGTGKTPAIMFLARWFREKGLRVSVISRGYKAGADGTNDEAKEMELRLPDVPHLQNPDRVAAAQVAIEELETEMILLDDGFQHRRIHRDLNIVLIDATEPFGYDHLLPRGLLRETIRSLRRVDIVIATRADQVEPQQLADIRNRIQRYSPKAAWVETEHRPQRLRNSQGQFREVSWLGGKRVLAFCGLGNPSGFFETLRSLNSELLDSIVFPDHHAYDQDDIERIRRATEAASKVDAILCSGKDLSKIGVDRIGNTPLWSLDIELSVRQGIEPLEERLEMLLQVAKSRRDEGNIPL